MDWAHAAQSESEKAKRDIRGREDENAQTSVVHQISKYMQHSQHMRNLWSLKKLA